MGSPEVTRVLSDIAAGDGSARERLWPLVYDELRKLFDRDLVAAAYCAMAEYARVPHAIGVGSGTDALAPVVSTSRS